ncbi:hypothetical protein, partial [Providencia stuartii]|uniref:hypothetical protein n=1 Tax=Providencia stuartii TaxID=588 RepID=UPI001123E5EF
MEVGVNSEVSNRLNDLINDFYGMLENGLSSYEKYFAKENINYHEISIDDFTITIKSTIRFLEEAYELYVKNKKAIDDVGLNDELLKIINKSFYTMNWVQFEDEKTKRFRQPTKEEVINQIKSYLAILNINARCIIDAIN